MHRPFDSCCNTVTGDDLWLFCVELNDVDNELTPELEFMLLLLNGPPYLLSLSLLSVFTLVVFCSWSSVHSWNNSEAFILDAVTKRKNCHASSGKIQRWNWTLLEPATKTLSSSRRQFLRSISFDFLQLPLTKRKFKCRLWCLSQSLISKWQIFNQ